MFKNIFKIISFILVCATAFTFVACTPTISSGDESGSDTNNGLIGGGTQIVIDESLPEDQDTEKANDETTKKPTNETTKKPTTSSTYVVKGYLLSASTPADTYGNGMSMVYKLSDGRLFVFDSGNASTKNFFIDALKKISGVSRPKIAAWVVTHEHGDHYGALIEYYYANAATINQTLDIQEIWMNPVNDEGKGIEKHFRNAFPNAKIRNLKYGEEITLDKIKITVLSTPDKVIGKSGVDVNSYSLVMMLNIGGKKILMTGDANKPTWDFMVDQQKNGEKYSLKCDFLQVPHHGVHDAATTAGYNAANPRYLVIPSTIDLANKLTTSTNAGPSYNLYKKHGINIGNLTKETDNMTYWFAGCYGKAGTQDIKCFFTYKGK